MVKAEENMMNLLERRSLNLLVKIKNEIFYINFANANLVDEQESVRKCVGSGESFDEAFSDFCLKYSNTKGYSLLIDRTKFNTV